LNVTGCSVNALPHPDKLACEIHVTDAMSQSLTDTQAQHGCDSKNGAEWSAFPKLHLLIALPRQFP